MTTESDKKFERFYNAVVSKRSVCWTCIFRFLRENNFLNDFLLRNENQIIAFFLEVLMKYDCGDKTILYRVLDFCFRWHFHHCQCNDKSFEMEYMEAIMKPLRVLKSSRPNKSLSRMNLKALPICNTNVWLMLVLSKYGIHVGKSVFDINNARKIIINFLISLRDNDGMFRSFHEFSDIAARVLDSFMRPANCLPCGVNYREKQYIFLMIRTLQAIELYSAGNFLFSGFIKCFEIFYRTIRHPFVSQEDMKVFLRVLLSTSSFSEDKLPMLIQIYTNIFKSPKFYSPRPLKHLCRISLRHILRKKSKLLPDSVKKLFIPRDLHAYLLCVEPLM